MTFSLFLTRLGKIYQVIRSKQLLKVFIIQGVLAGTEHRPVFESRIATVVDIGANRGQFALAARRWIPKAQIISFEPLEGAATVYRNVFREDAASTLYQAAIGPYVGETTIHVSAADDSSSILSIQPLQERLYPGTGEIRKEVVKIGPLSYYLMPKQIVSPAMLKLDVQGYESKALRGCESLLDCFSSIYVEGSFVELYDGQALVGEVIAWLRVRGWNLNGIFNISYDRHGQSIQADFLFKRTSMMCKDL